MCGRAILTKHTGDDVRKRFTGNAKIDAVVKDIQVMVRHEQKEMEG